MFSLRELGARGIIKDMCMPWVQGDTLGTRSYAGSSAESTKTPSHFAGAFRKSGRRSTICHRYSSSIWMPARSTSAGQHACHGRALHSDLLSVLLLLQVPPNMANC